MPGFLNNDPLAKNAIEKLRLERLAKNLPLLDLSDANPTNSDLLIDVTILTAEIQKYLNARQYRPDPQGLLAAREAISKYYLQKNLTIPSEQIFLTASTSEAYRFLFSLLADPGDTILFPEITYPLFEYIAADTHITPHTYRFRYENLNWSIDESSFDSCVDTRTRALCIVSPHNPTGLVHQSPLKRIEELNLPIISDEVFSEFTSPDFPNGAPHLGLIYPNLPVFHLSGISKMFALPDLKVGWIALNTPAYAQFGKRLEILCDTYLSVNSLGANILPRLFETSQDFIRKMNELINQRRELAVSALNSILEFPQNTTGPFLFPKLPMNSDAEDYVKKLISKGLYLHPGTFYNWKRDSRIVISLVPKQDILTMGSKILKNTH
jgi:alanine-synthesizing transaminase